MFISGATPKSEVEQLLKKWTDSSNKFKYSAKLTESAVGKIWKVTTSKKKTK